MIDEYCENFYDKKSNIIVKVLNFRFNGYDANYKNTYYD